MVKNCGKKYVLKLILSMTIKMTPAPLCSDDYLATSYSYSYQLLVTKALLGQSLRPGNNKVKRIRFIRINMTQEATTILTSIVCH